MPQAAPRAASLTTALFALVATGTSLVFACAAPFAALAFVAVWVQPPRQAAVTVLLAWVVNQALGYGLLGYPVDASSILWGLAIGMAALLPLPVLWQMRVRLPQGAFLALGFPAAFAVYQLGLFVISRSFASGPGGFSLQVIGEVLQANLIGLAALVAGQLLVKLLLPRPARPHAA